MDEPGDDEEEEGGGGGGGGGLIAETERDGEMLRAPRSKQARAALCRDLL